MIIQKRLSFGLGTIFSLIIAYFIFLYSKEKGWALLAFLSKWYLIIAGILIALPLLILILIFLVSLAVFLIALARMKTRGKKHKNKNAKNYIDAEYTLKE